DVRVATRRAEASDVIRIYVVAHSGVEQVVWVIRRHGIQKLDILRHGDFVLADLEWMGDGTAVAVIAGPHEGAEDLDTGPRPLARIAGIADGNRLDHNLAPRSRNARQRHRTRRQNEDRSHAWAPLLLIF